MTGFARHSLGEAFGWTFVCRRTEASVIGIDRIQNPGLAEYPDFRQIEFDLNPLNCKDGLGGFVSRLAERLFEGDGTRRKLEA